MRGTLTAPASRYHHFQTFYYSFLIGEKTRAEKEQATCPGPPDSEGAQKDLNSGMSDARLSLFRGAMSLTKILGSLLVWPQSAQHPGGTLVNIPIALVDKLRPREEAERL